MKKLIALFLLTSSIAFAQQTPQRVQTTPSTQNGAIQAIPNYPHYGTTTGGVQTIIPAPTVQDAARVDCLILNTGLTHTFYIDFGVPASASSLPVVPGAGIKCSDNMMTNVDAISLYDATSGDPYYILVTIQKQN